MKHMLENRHKDIVEEENKISMYMDKIQNLEQEIINLRKELEESKYSLISIDQQRDEIQNLLDEKTEENLKLNKILH